MGGDRAVDATGPGVHALSDGPSGTLSAVDPPTVHMRVGW
jgi:hypothetical protein